MLYLIKAWDEYVCHGQENNLHDELDLRNADNFDKPIIALLGKWAVGSAVVV